MAFFCFYLTAIDKSNKRIECFTRNVPRYFTPNHKGQRPSTQGREQSPPPYMINFGIYIIVVITIRGNKDGI